MYRRFYRNRITKQTITGKINIRRSTVTTGGKTYDAQLFFESYEPITKRWFKFYRSLNH